MVRLITGLTVLHQLRLERDADAADEPVVGKDLFAEKGPRLRPGVVTV